METIARGFGYAFGVLLAMIVITGLLGLTMVFIYKLWRVITEEK